ncbi:hypothetical protein HDU86_006050 [Geranomyces michiganensis]|nr:hypothetical protein HDU86_006050 [Geranomyces michiganensis]
MSRLARVYEKWSASEVVNFDHDPPQCPPVPNDMIMEGRLIHRAQAIATRNESGTVATTLIACGMPAAVCATGQRVPRRQRLCNQGLNGITSVTSHFGLVHNTRVFIMAHPAYLIRSKKALEQELRSTARTLYVAFAVKELLDDEFDALTAITSNALGVLLGLGTEKLSVEQLKKEYGYQSRIFDSIADRKAFYMRNINAQRQYYIRAGVANTPEEASNYLLHRARTAQRDRIVALGFAKDHKEAIQYLVEKARTAQLDQLIAKGLAKDRKEAGRVTAKHARNAQLDQLIAKGLAKDREEAARVTANHAHNAYLDQLVAKDLAKDSEEAGRVAGNHWREAGLQKLIDDDLAVDLDHANEIRVDNMNFHFLESRRKITGNPSLTLEEAQLHQLDEIRKKRAPNGAATYEDLVVGFKLQFVAHCKAAAHKPVPKPAPKLKSSLTLKMQTDDGIIAHGFTWQGIKLADGETYVYRFSKKPEGLVLEDTNGKILAHMPRKSLQKKRKVTPAGSKAQTDSTVLGEWFETFYKEQKLKDFGEQLDKDVV